MTIAERVIAFLSKSGRGWDDDELARQLGVSPRQTINQVCRRLEREGRLRRYPGPDGKIVNSVGERAGEAAGPGRSGPVRAPAQPGSAVLPAGHSDEQREAERLIMDEAGRELGVRLEPRRIDTPTGVGVEVDGADRDVSVLVEAWAHQGPVKPAQRNKVLADALKLVWISSTLDPRPRRVLCLSAPEAARGFRGGGSWAAAALADLQVEIMVVELPGEVRERLRAAQRRQFR